jgi:hypothetical protein
MRPDNRILVNKDGLAEPNARHWQGRWIGGPQGRFRTFQVDPKDLAGPQVDNCPHQLAYAGRDTMYPYSPSLQSLPVPGIGFCHSVSVGQCAVDQSHERVWPFIRGWALISADRTPRELSDVAAAGYQLH